MKMILAGLCVCFGLLALVYLIVRLKKLRRQTLVRNKIIIDNSKLTSNRSTLNQSSSDNVFEVSSVRVEGLSAINQEFFFLLLKDPANKSVFNSIDDKGKLTKPINFTPKDKEKLVKELNSTALCKNFSFFIQNKKLIIYVIEDPMYFFKRYSNIGGGTEYCAFFRAIIFESRKQWFFKIRAPGPAT
jgi:hypothetical protein